MRIGLRHYGTETVDWLKARLGAGDCTRTFLARELCEREDWRNAKGEPCLASARAALPKLSSALGLPLPEARPMGGVTSGSMAPSPGYPDMHLSCGLDDLGEISVVPVAEDDKALARSKMASHHPEGDAACPGGRIRYWIRSTAHGVLGGLTVGAASWHHKARDLHIGWSQAARAANIGRVVNNDRLLLLPGVRVHGLASVALSLFHGCTPIFGVDLIPFFLARVRRVARRVEAFLLPCSSGLDPCAADNDRINRSAPRDREEESRRNDSCAAVTMSRGPMIRMWRHP